MGITLAEALRELRRELYAAQAESAGEQFRFEVERAELSLEVEYRRDSNGGVKVEVGLPGAKAGGEAGRGSGDTRRQTLTLTLQVRDEALGGERARIRRGAGGLAPLESDGAECMTGDELLDGASDASEARAEPQPRET